MTTTPRTATHDTCHPGTAHHPRPGTERRRRLRWSPAVGPAFVAAIAYVDPGNIATNVSAGSSYGFTLLWIVVLATLMAAPVQYLSSKLGTVTGLSLPDHIVGRSNRLNRTLFRAQAGTVAVATDLAELVGAAVGLHILFGVPLMLGCLAAAVVSLLMLRWRDHRGGRGFEVVCVGTLLLMAAGIGIGLVPNLPGSGNIASGLVPRLHNEEMALLAVGIVGATIMPHAIYLHSGLSAERVAGADRGLRSRRRHHAFPSGGKTIEQRMRMTRWDVGTAMLVAGSVNISLLLLGAVTIPQGVEAEFGAVSEGLREGAGSLAAYGFGIALVASGFMSSAVGTHAGSVMLTGLFNRRSGLLLRRIVTVIPAMAMLVLVADPMRALVFSQVILALGLPFALAPLVWLTARRSVMGRHINTRLTAIVAAVMTVVIALDLGLILLALP